MSLLQLALNISNAIDDLYDHDEPFSEFAQFEAIYNELVSHDDYDFSDFEPIDDDTDNFTTADPIPEPEGAYEPDTLCSQVEQIHVPISNLAMKWYEVFTPCPEGSQAAKGAK